MDTAQAIKTTDRHPPTRALRSWDTLVRQAEAARAAYRAKHPLQTVDMPLPENLGHQIVDAIGLLLPELRAAISRALAADHFATVLPYPAGVIHDHPAARAAFVEALNAKLPPPFAVRHMDRTLAIATHTDDQGLGYVVGPSVIGSLQTFAVSWQPGDPAEAVH